MRWGSCCTRKGRPKPVRGPRTPQVHGSSGPARTRLLMHLTGSHKLLGWVLATVPTVQVTRHCPHCAGEQMSKLGLRAAKQLSKGKEQAGDRASAPIPSLSPMGLATSFLVLVDTEPAGSGNEPHRAGRNCRLVPAALSTAISAAGGVAGARPPAITPWLPGPGHQTSKGEEASCCSPHTGGHGKVPRDHVDHSQGWEVPRSTGERL